MQGPTDPRETASRQSRRPFALWSNLTRAIPGLSGLMGAAGVAGCGKACKPTPPDLDCSLPENKQKFVCDECGDVWSCINDTDWVVGEHTCDCVTPEGHLSDTGDCPTTPY